MAIRKGDVYIVHFDIPYKGCRHYIGFTQLGIIERLKRHKQGNGAKLLNALNKAGINYDVSNTFFNVSQAFERHLKRQKNSKRFCPLCK